MIKKIKGLTALWLALIMVLTMVPAMGASGAHGNHVVYLMDIPFLCTISPENHFGDGLDDWNQITTQGSLEYTYTVEPGGTVTLPTHKNPCEQYAKGYAKIFMGWKNCNHQENELLPGGTYTNDQIHQWGLKQSSGGLECWGDARFSAVFDYGYWVDVSNGSGDNYYAEGQSVTIKADAISGKRFKKWEVKAALVEVDIPTPRALSLEDEGSEGDSSSMPALEGFDETAATTTFVMPGAVALTFTAKYEDVPVTPSTPGYDWYIPAPEEVEPETEDCWKVNCNKLNVRKGPSLFAGVITKLERGACINGGELTEDGKWIRYEVEEGVYGYVSADYVIACDCLDHIDLPMEKFVLCRKLNVRSGAGTSFAKVGNLTRGETVKIVSCDCSGWVKIEYNGGYAWISAAYIG